jgi:hypothetical protein
VTAIAVKATKESTRGEQQDKVPVVVADDDDDLQLAVRIALLVDDGSMFLYCCGMVAGRCLSRVPWSGFAAIFRVAVVVVVQ